MKRRYCLILSIIGIMGIIFISGCVQQNTKEIEELEIKSYLIEKYNPGLCLGMPSPFDQEMINRTLNQNPDLVAFVKKKFEVSKDYEIHGKILQLNGIILSKTNTGYNFTFKDGKCCDITTYEGKIKIVGDQITDEITNKYTESSPC